MTAITEAFAPLICTASILVVICLFAVMALTFPGESK